jgi:16S rRNA (uracil1498-N3)-methyltransferase
MQLYFQADLSIAEGTLNPDESVHLAKVLRARAGDQILLTDGKGTCATVELVEVSRHGCKYRVVSGTARYSEKRPTVHLAIAPLHHADRMEWLLEKAVEIGVGKIQLLKTARSVEHQRVKNDRAQRIMLAAMKQSQRWFLPDLLPEMILSEFLNINRNDKLLLAHCLNDEKARIVSTHRNNDHTWLIIGPEGDFSPDEVKMCLAVGAQAVSLGQARLRSETAAIFGLSVLNAIQDS